MLWLDLDGRICHLQTAEHFGKAELQRNIDCESMLQFERGKKKKKSELSLKKKNLEEQRVDTQKMEKKNVKISLSLSLSLKHTHTHTHTTHMQSFLCTGKGEKYKQFQGHRKTTRTKTKKEFGNLHSR